MKKRILAFALTVAMAASVLAGLVSVPGAQASTTNYVDVVQTYQVGDIVTFGNYWQNDTNGDGAADQNDEKEPIEWRVLSLEGDDLFLMATKGLDAQPYNETWTDVTWETCTLRTWLNETFYNDAFSIGEQNAIKKTVVKNNDNPEYGTDCGDDTTDKVFLLSFDEVTNVDYGFASASTQDVNRLIKPTEYTGNFSTYNGICYWWLRSMGSSGTSVGLVNAGGTISFSGDISEFPNGVCPALHIDMQYVDQIPLINSTESPTQTYQTGDIVTFGNYWQNDTNGDGTADQNDEKEPIEWRVLSQEGSDVFLMSNKALDSQQYNAIRSSITWETCSLRVWLNDTFYKNAFSTNEMQAVKTTKLVNDDNFGIEGGNDTEDKVFLLSYGDATNTNYGFDSNDLADDYNRRVKATEYAKTCGAEVSNYIEYEGNCWWWLRSPGTASYVASEGACSGCIFVQESMGCDVSFKNAVVPAMHIDLNFLTDPPKVVIPAEPKEEPTAIPTSIPTATPSAIAIASVAPSATATATVQPSVSATMSATVESDKKYQTGDIVTFGNYWQNDTNGDGTADQYDAKEPIEWRVLSQDGDDLFLMATKGLDAQPYNAQPPNEKTAMDVTWEICTLRTWLNNNFYNDAFSASEQNAIKITNT